MKSSVVKSQWGSRKLEAPSRARDPDGRTQNDPRICRGPVRSARRQKERPGRLAPGPCMRSAPHSLRAPAPVPVCLSARSHIRRGERAREAQCGRSRRRATESRQMDVCKALGLLRLFSYGLANL